MLLAQFLFFIFILLMQVFWVTSAVLQGGMFFKEFQEMSDKQSMLFTTGVATVFVGVYLIATSQQSEEENESDLMGNMDGDRDRLTDPEKGENCESDLSRRRVDGNVMIITCIGSPIKFERNRKLGNSNYSNCSSSRSSNFDGCDRYFEDFSAIEALNIDESPTEVELEVADSGISFSPVTIAHLATNSLKSPSRLSPPAIMNPLHLSEYNANPHGTSTLISSHLLSSGVSHELPSSPKLSFSVCVDSVPLAEGEELNHVKGSCTDVAPGRRLSHLDPLDGSAAENNSAS